MNYKTFQSPPAEFRSVPFWSLNHWLEADELARQLEAFKAGGYGGAYLHSRIGLQTRYLGEDWWKAMDACVEACRRLGIEAWFYDEDRWPSGFAGGEVPLRSEEFHARCLMRLPADQATPATAEVLARDDEHQYLCYKVRMGDPWHNGTCWVDLLNPATVAAFIDCSYKPYAERYAACMGDQAKGIFTDEPQVRPVTDGVPDANTLSYSPVVREDFRRRYGYDLIDHVASLFEPVGEWRKVRLHYYRTMALRFEESFSRQIGDYCDRTKMVWTGHYNGEENFHTVITNVGNMMIQYRHPVRPGMDWLGLTISGGLNSAKSLSSAANQYGRGRRLSEMFGISGQNMNFEDRKWIADWHAVLGVNHVCPHLALYSMAGCRKRDFPPTLSDQQPWWPYNGILEDHLARVSYATTVGRFAAEALVLHPLESAHMIYPERDIVPPGASVSADEGDLFARFERVMQRLLEAHRDWDLGDEQILADIGKVAHGALVVGEMAYRAVILPYMATIRPSTLKLLGELAAAGGTIIAVGYLPGWVDAEENPQALAALAKTARVVQIGELAAAFAAAMPAAVRVSGEGAENVWTHRRVTAAGQIVMLTNTSRLRAVDATVTLGQAAPATLWDVDSGQCLALRPEKDGSIRLHLAPAQTFLLTTGDASVEAKPAGQYDPDACVGGADVLALTGPWAGGRKDPNALTLDFARYSTDGGKSFSAPEPIIGIHERFTEQAYAGPLTLAFDVRIDELPTACTLVVEQPAMYTAITVNGQATTFGERFYRDHTFRCAEVTGLLKAGDNTIVLELDFVPPAPASPTNVAGLASAGLRTSGQKITPLWELEPLYRYGTEIESIYLVGEFGVAADRADEPPAETERNKRGYLPPMPVHRFKGFRIVGEADRFEGDLTPQGYPFFAGAFELRKSFDAPAKQPGKRYLLLFGQTETQVICAELNGKPLPPLTWQPMEIDITDALQAGANELKLTVLNAMRNLLGPHHHRDGELVGCGPGSFTGRATWTGGGPGDNDWFDLRRDGKPTKIWRDDYHHIPFGLLEPPKIIVRG